MSTDSRPRRFGPEFVTAQRSRYGGRPPEQRELTYDIAVEEQYSSWRSWLDDQLDLLPAKEADAFARKLWFDQYFWGDNIELATGAVLRGTGLPVAYEHPWGKGNLTPDWTVLDAAGNPLALVEVVTDSPSKETYGQMRAWHSLVERIKKIPLPVVLALAPKPDGPYTPPDARTAKRIAQDLHRYLMSPLQLAVFPTQGYTFLLQGDPRTRAAMRAPGMSAIFIPPSSLAGQVTAEPLAQRIGEKVSKYRDLARELRVPLIVATGAHRFTGVGLEQLDHLLAGQPVLTIQFGYGDTHAGQPVNVDLGAPARWSMPPDLAGVLWINTTSLGGPPYPAHWRPNDSALRPAPAALSGGW
ncbi:hypothetical protein [Kitasatospora sp. MBT63]|uniref:hypothetical protein n=1 Tax=Kitasatospora sp. MBT63 TaxID=1444768 RepID=UPI00053A9BEE|nr:hypothetical protein [Kitasatospora sp. MBT63]